MNVHLGNGRQNKAATLGLRVARNPLANGHFLHRIRRPLGTVTWMRPGLMSHSSFSAVSCDRHARGCPVHSTTARLGLAGETGRSTNRHTPLARCSSVPRCASMPTVGCEMPSLSASSRNAHCTRPSTGCAPPSPTRRHDLVNRVPLAPISEPIWAATPRAQHCEFDRVRTDHLDVLPVNGSSVPAHLCGCQMSHPGRGRRAGLPRRCA